MVDGVGVIGLDGLNGVIVCMGWMKRRAGRVGKWVAEGGGLGGEGLE